MSANFFKLPESDKRKIWAALLKEWAAKKADPDGKLTSGALVEVRKKAFDRVCRLRNALDDFDAQEW